MKTENKALAFLSAISNAYKEEEEREDFPKIEINMKDITGDLTAMLMALFMTYRNLTGDEEKDIVGFTYLLNRLAIQYVMDNMRDEEQEGE